jgi:hypothetical protein
MSTQAVPSTSSVLIETPKYKGQEVDLARTTVYVEFSLRKFGTLRKVPESLWSQLGIKDTISDWLDLDDDEGAQTKLDKRLLKITKHLLESSSLKCIESYDAHTRDWLGRRCLPFKRGVHFLPLSLVDLVEGELRARRAKRETELVPEFLEEYPTLCRQAARKLPKKIYNPADYPSVDEVEAAFSMKWRYLKFGVPEKLAEVNPELLKQAREEAVREAREVAADIQSLMRAQTLALVKNLRDKLQPGPDGRKKKLTDAAFTNLAEFLAYFDHRNIVNDRDLKSVVDELRTRLGQTDVEQVRSSDNLRLRLGEEMNSLTNTLESMIQLVPKRKMLLQ